MDAATPAPSAVAAKRGRAALVAVLALAAVGLGLIMNREGVDLSPDGGAYATSGILFARGEGVSRPNPGVPEPHAWFPPFVAWLVGLCESAGWNIAVAMGVLNALAWGALAAAVGIFARRALGGDPWWAAVAAGLILTSSHICEMEGMLLSEPWFLLWFVFSLAALGEWWDRPSFALAALAGGCVAGALLTRYVGVTLIALGAPAMLLRSIPFFRARIPMVLLFGFIAGAPVVLWTLWQKMIRGGDAPRPIERHLIQREQLVEGFNTLASFIITDDFVLTTAGRALVLLVTLAIASWALVLWLRRGDGPAPRERLAATPGLIWLSAAFAPVYLGFLVISISFADAGTPLDSRILIPLVPAGALVATWLAVVGPWRHGSRTTRWVLVALTGGVLVLHAVSTAGLIYYREAVTWSQDRPSLLGQAVRDLPADAVIYTNEPFAVYYVSRRKTDLLPDDAPDEEADDDDLAEFDEHLAELRAALVHGGWIVYFNKLCLNESPLSRARAREALTVESSRIFEDGVLLRIAPSPGE